MKNYKVNTLLSMSRLPEHFYGIIYKLNEKDSLYKNPGISLRSFLVANHLSKEIISLEGDILTTIKECIDFSVSKNIISQIISFILLESSSMAKIISDYKQKAGSNKLIGISHIDIANKIENLANNYEEIINKNCYIDDQSKFDIFAKDSYLLSSMIDINLELLVLKDFLNNLPPLDFPTGSPTTPGKAA